MISIALLLSPPATERERKCRRSSAVDRPDVAFLGAAAARVVQPDVAASQAKIYRELWERAEKLGADAVINAKYGNSHISAFSWGKTNATGTAIKFTTAPATPSAASDAPSAPPAPAATAPAGQ